MRRITYILCLLMLLLGACRKEPAHRAVPVVSNVPIEFRAKSEDSATKGLQPLINLERLATQKFGVSAWYTPDGETFGTQSTSYIQNHRFGTLSTSDYEHATWCGVTPDGTETNPVYYPLDGSLSYFCYAPFSQNVLDDSSEIKLVYDPDSEITDNLSHYLPGSPLIQYTPSQIVSIQRDFIVSTPVLNTRRNSDAIELDFTHHLTTQIQFWCKYSGVVDSGQGVTISQISLQNVISSEYLYFTEENGHLGCEWCSTISPSGSETMPKATYVFNNTAISIEGTYLDDSVYKPVNDLAPGRTFMLPQTLPSTASLDVTYKIQDRLSHQTLEENTLSISLYNTTPWPLGKKVNYYIEIEVAPRKTINLTAVTIEGWDESHNLQPSAEELIY